MYSTVEEHCASQENTPAQCEAGYMRKEAC